ncbi:hypothetical protein [Methylocystis sp. ATCC 49242]|uniref:hypothetical protein n=1 Tax=Methylocystis sp. ATCC 49242 TaxID=622637 RepID=UPI0001F8785A|nr:hypothetical protein [Methylocystis sp. ATCC 49242]
MTEATQQTEELEELDIIDALDRAACRLIALDLAIKGAGLSKDVAGALGDFIFFVRADLEELSDNLTDQDKAKRERGEPRIERIFSDGREP